MYVCVPGRTRRSLWRVNRFDFVVWIVTYICTAFVSITIGLVVGVALNCLLLIVQAQRVRGGQLTRAADTEIYYYRRPPTTESKTGTALMPIGVVVYRYSRPITQLSRLRFDLVDHCALYKFYFVFVFFITAADIVINSELCHYLPSDPQ